MKGMKQMITLEEYLEKLKNIEHKPLPENAFYDDSGEWEDWLHGGYQQHLLETEYLYNGKQPLNVYMYGSLCYGTDDEYSDHDCIAVYEGYEGLKDQFKTASGDDVTVYDEKSFQEAINNHEITVLEALSCRDGILKETKEFTFVVDKSKLRHKLSAIASNSFVKAKKKMTVEKDYDLRIAKKSLFHSLRILMFGKQLAEYGTIVNFHEASKYWYEIDEIDSSDWNVYKEKYQPIYNQLSTEFKKVAPKEEV
jgi:hypothetical protein